MTHLFAFLFLTFSAQAQSSFGGFNPMEPPSTNASYEGRLSPGSNSTNWIEHKASFSTPIHKSEKDTVALTVSGGTTHLSEAPTLDSGKEVPTDLYRLELSTNYSHKLEDRKSWGLRVVAGYDGDKPFKKSEDLTYSVSANYGFPGSGKGYWLLYVFFSNNSLLGDYIPIPGFSYLYRSEDFTGSFGLPILALQWKFAPLWYYSFFALGPMIQTELGYGDIKTSQVFFGFYWVRQRYILSDRDEVRDRLTVEEKKIALGVRAPLGQKLMAEFQTGQAFDRTFYVSDRLFGKDGGSTLIKPDWFASLNLKMKF